MQIDIKEQKKVPLLKRTEVIARITFKGSTPSRDEVCKMLAKKLDANTSLMIVKKINTDFGNEGGQVTAQVYDSQEAMIAFAPKMGKKAREKIEAEKKKEEEKKKAAEEKKKTEEKKTAGDEGKSE